MAAPEYVIKNLNLFVDGKGYAGKIRQGTPPKFNLVTEEFRGGGMNGPLELTMGHEALNMGFQLIDFSPDVMALWRIREGFNFSFNLRGQMEDIDGVSRPIKWDCRGKIKGMDSGDLTPGTAGTLTMDVALSYVKLTHNGRVIHEVDVINMVQIIDGVDLLQGARDALGI